MKKKIPCPECNGRGGKVVFNGTADGGCTVTYRRCLDCDGNGIVFADMSRADLIRAMSDEELAAYWSYHYDDFCPNLPECGEMQNQDQEIPAEKCIGCALRWLQEVEP